ncbi:MAG: hypothetical protein ACE5LU_08460 [Anaerolineae bacterium]
MPHDTLSKLRYLVATLICLLGVSQTVPYQITSAQSGPAEPVQALRTWSEPIPISDLNESGNVENPAIAVCPDGTAYVVWEQDDAIWYRVYRPSAGWNEASPILPGLNARGSEPAIAVSSDCVLHLVWSKLWGYNSEIFYTFNDGNGFVTPARVSRTETQSFQPDVALDSGGNLHVVWVETVSGGYQLYEGWPTPNLPWSKKRIKGGDGQLVQVPALAIDRDDRSHLTWMRQDKSSLDIIYKRPDDWPTGVIENISYSANPSRLPDIAIGGDQVVVVWQETVDGDDDVYVTWRRLDSNFVSVSNLSDTDASSRAPAVAADGLGEFFVAWDEGSPTHAILTRPWPGIGNWWDFHTVSHGGTNVKHPALAAASGDRHVYAVWAQQDSPEEDTWVIYFSDMQLMVHRFYLALIAKGYAP